MPVDKTIDYIEIQAADLPAAKRFYAEAFGWSFEDWGDEYCSFSDGRMTGGIRRGEHRSDADSGSALIILYAEDLEALRETVVASGGKIKTDIFSFPGGRRFHFLDPHGNELAAWSDGGQDSHSA